MMRLSSCLVPLLLASTTLGQSAEWPQWRGPMRDGTWTETKLLEKLPRRLEAKWRKPVKSGYSGPTVAAGRVYVMDRVSEPDEIERVHCFDATDGSKVWSHEYAAEYGRVSYKAGPRCSVLIHDGLAYSLGTMGHLFCFDAKSGAIVWSKNLDETYEIQLPIWGIAASPVIEDDLLIVPASAKDAYLVALDRKTGKEVWKAFDDRGNYSAPIVVTHSKQRVVICWTGDRVIGVAPATGKLLWQHPFKARKMPLGIAAPVLAGDKLFLSGFYDGSLLLRLKPDELAVEELWRRRGQSERSTDALHAMIGTPLILGKHIYGVDSYGQLRCLDLATGDRIWEDKTAVPQKRWATIHCVQNGERTWMFNERGELLIAKLTEKRFHELSRTKLIEPTRDQLNRRGGVCWSHPAFANRHVFVRNDKELACFDLSAK